ncbi:hypothetical protein QYS49_05470 [Marivirga salinae]|uniref:Uncharacterized protein n=1 Tax=Marivirga salinarum TaxID=3059078 RepID=A0AA49GAS3_9BACT|nr:hypothetical protein [Marivirga sp. BDSF4-3]WKK76731.2 hypothetical protein QYS49_05470 [Marivirga sp. BDSF4-3]
MNIGFKTKLNSVFKCISFTFILIVFFGNNTIFAQIQVQDIFYKVNGDFKTNNKESRITHINHQLETNFTYPEAILESGLDGQALLHLFINNGEIEKVINENIYFSYKFFEPEFSIFLKRELDTFIETTDGKTEIFMHVNFFLPSRNKWNSKNYNKQKYYNEVKDYMDNLESEDIEINIAGKLNSLLCYNALDIQVRELLLRALTVYDNQPKIQEAKKYIVLLEKLNAI